MQGKGSGFYDDIMQEHVYLLCCDKILSQNLPKEKYTL